MLNKELINKSIDYILQHLEDDISVDDVANHFYFSKFYFCRSFKAMTGESVYEFIKRMKMDQSAVEIKLEKKKPITNIGINYGYSSSNYSTAFQKHHNISPAKFRKSADVTGMTSPFYPEGLSGFDTFEGYNSKIKIQELPDFFVIYERIIGNYVELKENWFQFLDQYKDHIKVDTLLIERFYDDPAITSLNRCLCDICMTTDEACTLKNVTMVKGGKFAVFCFDGKIEDIFCTIQGIFSVWLPKSNYEMDGRCGLNIYRKINGESGCVIMDVCIPIR
ncbi:MAG: AraC family transcriptional regulator [Bacillota bacterium]|jgi:AraC family transcriptional regulator|nr:AraC family transcriptional regulator [Bacillota bacterium]